MKYSLSAVLLIAGACATTPPEPPLEPLVPVQATEADAFQIEVTDREPETRRYRIKPEDLLADADEKTILLNEEGGRTGSPHSDAAASVARMIRVFVAPGSWDADARRTVFVEGKDLVVRHTPEVLGLVERFIETLKLNKAALLSLSARILTVSPELLSALEPLPMVEGGVGAVFEAAPLRDALRKRLDRLITAPKLTVFHGQKGSVSVRSDFAYIAGYRKNGPLFEPQPRVEWAGFHLDAQVVANGPGSHRWLLNLAVTGRDLPGIPSVPAVNLSGRLHEMPKVVQHQPRGRFVLRSGEAVLLLAPEVKALEGIAGRLASDPAAPPRVTLIVVELVRAE